MQSSNSERMVPVLTILTATFNRQKTLPRLYESLCRQTQQGFEWVVVDDGSTDQTPELVHEFREQATFPIQYVRKLNGGKHSALNIGVPLVRGGWIHVVDSDDFLEADSVANVVERLYGLGDGVVGLIFRKAHLDGALIGVHDIVGGPAEVTPSEAASRFGGDLDYVFRADVMRRHPFPIIAGEKFVPELFVWNKIGDEGVLRAFGEVVLSRCEYLPDGYSANFRENLKRNPRGFLIFYADQFQRERTVFGRLKCLVRVFECLIRAHVKRVIS